MKSFIAFFIVLAANTPYSYALSNLGQTSCHWLKGEFLSKASGQILGSYGFPRILSNGSQIVLYVQNSDLHLKNLAYPQYPIVANENCITQLARLGSTCFFYDDRNSKFNVFVDTRLFQGAAQGELTVLFDPSGNPQGPQGVLQQDTYSCTRN